MTEHERLTLLTLMHIAHGIGILMPDASTRPPEAREDYIRTRNVYQDGLEEITAAFKRMGGGESG